MTAAKTVQVLDRAEEQDISSTTVPTSSPNLREQAIRAIQRETDCSHRQAKRLINWLDQLIHKTRKYNYESYYLTDLELMSPSYELFDTVIPHDQVSTRGSAHELLEKLLLDPTKGELGFTHQMRDQHGELTYCNFCVNTTAVR